ncbi:MAG: hypothetical protein JWQ85_4111 [Mucilaginibacter sp.]|nr:hypothetical protein [Mucilaginibacter sp.]
MADLFVILNVVKVRSVHVHGRGRPLNACKRLLITCIEIGY